jgi:hypothetical protein
VEVLDGGRVRIGAGATWGSAAATLAEHGLAITSGDTVSVGVGGLTQAGGIGWMVRKYGLTIDSVLAAEMVTAAGEVVHADPETDPELFWGLLGGAGNFGVVTSFDYQAQQVSTVHFGVITYALEDVAQLLKGWREVMRNAPDELTTTLVLMPGFGDFPAGAMLYACYCGDDPSEIDPLRAIGSVTSDDVSERPYADVLEEAHPPQGVLPVIGNTLVDSLSADCIRAIVTAYDEGGRVVFLRSLGGAVGRVSPEATAFAHRDAEALIVSAKFLPESADPEDLAALYPAETLARLVELKRVWDPANLFGGTSTSSRDAAALDEGSRLTHGRAGLGDRQDRVDVEHAVADHELQVPAGLPGPLGQRDTAGIEHVVGAAEHQRRREAVEPAEPG